MNPKKKLSRRNILKTGIAGATTILVPQLVSATEREINSNYVERILNNPKVETIIDIVGELQIENVVEKEFEIDGTLVTGTWIETKTGDLTCILPPEEDEPEVELNIENPFTNKDLRWILSNRFSIIPKDTVVKIIGDKTAPNLIRSLSSDEKIKIRKLLEPSEEMLNAFYRDNSGHYKVIASDKEGELTEYIVKSNPGRRPNPTNEIAEVVNPNWFSRPCWMSSACASCATWVVGKGLCYGSCVAGMGWTCLACVANTNAALLFSDCDTCISDCA